MTIFDLLNFRSSLKIFLSLVLLISFQSARSAVPNKLISGGISKKLEAVESPESWKGFVSANKELFPQIKSESDSPHVIVRKEELEVDGSFFTLGVGYRQCFIKASMERVKSVLNSPHLFKHLYGLDADAVVGTKIDKKTEVRTGIIAEAKAESKTEAKVERKAEARPETKNGSMAELKSEQGLKESREFEARIFKEIKVPFIPNQDYVLKYSNEDFGYLWRQRAQLVKDNGNFALRDNLKFLEAAEGGVIFREISIIYALKWQVRFFGPSVRDIMGKELLKITKSVKCLSESQEPDEEAAAKKCWESSLN